MKTTVKNKRKKQPTKRGGAALKKKKLQQKKQSAYFNEGGATFYFTTSEVNIIRHAIKSSLIVEAEDLESVDLVKTPALSEQLTRDVQCLESIMNKLNFTE